MARLPKLNYSLALLVLVVALAGCALRRDSDELADPAPVSDLPPTLAPLGAETELVSEATPIPTVIAVKNPIEQAPANEEAVAETSVEAVVEEPVQAVEQSEPQAVNNEAEAASSITSENSASVAEEASADQITAPQESIVVDANTSDDLPVGGPVAANPPVSQTDPGYTTGYGDGGSYTVQPGDTLFSIATRHGTTVQAIIYANGLPTDVIYAGQELIIPSGDVSVPQYEQPTTYQQPAYQQPPYPQQPFVPTGGENYHLVARGETLYRIALQYGTSVDAIAGANGIPFPYLIQTGQQLVIPGPGYAGPPPPPPAGGYEQPYDQGYPPQAPGNEYYAPEQDNFNPNPGGAGTHTVAPGETLFSIAQRYGTTADALATANGLYNPNQIYVGQVLYLP